MDGEHFYNSNEDIYHLFVSLTIGQEINKKSHTGWHFQMGFALLAIILYNLNLVDPHLLCKPIIMGYNI